MAISLHSSSCKRKIYLLSLTENQVTTAHRLHVSQSTVSRVKQILSSVEETEEYA
ncbi:hypothetical protein BT96DRAFT_923454, partial [Gymnopus androsaceus JB14]